MISKNDYKMSVGRVILDSDIRPYKLVISVDFNVELHGLLNEVSVVEVNNHLIMRVLEFIKNLGAFKRLDVDPNLVSYFNNEIELSNNRILYSFIIRDTQGYKAWINGKDIIWYNESEVERYDNV